MTWLREIGLEFVDSIVKSDNEKTRSTVRAKSGSRMIIENSPGNLKSNVIGERAFQSVQGMIRTVRSAIEENWEVKIDVTLSVRPWIAQQSIEFCRQGSRSVVTAKDVNEATWR